MPARMTARRMRIGIPPVGSGKPPNDPPAVRGGQTDARGSGEVVPQTVAGASVPTRRPVSLSK